MENNTNERLGSGTANDNTTNTPETAQSGSLHPLCSPLVDWYATKVYPRPEKSSFFTIPGLTLIYTKETDTVMFETRQTKWTGPFDQFYDMFTLLNRAVDLMHIEPEKASL